MGCNRGVSSTPEPTIRSIATVVKTLKGMLADNRIAEAVSLYSQCHDDVGWRMMNEARSDEGLQRQCAMMFDRARDYKKAALLWGNLDDERRAAELYERACDYFMAGEIYARIGQAERAAVMYEKYGSYQIAGDLYAETGNKGRAALNYERAGQPFLAGKLYYEAGQFQRAIELLQRIEDNAQEYFSAVELIALTLVKTGAAMRGIRRLQSVLEELPIERNTLTLYRRLAELTDQWGDVEEAKGLYRDILAFEGENRAVQARLEQLEESGAEAPTLTWEEPTVSGSGDIEHHVVGLLQDFDFLRDIPLLEELSLEEMRAFFSLCHVARFRPGRVLIEQGEPGRSMHILRSGEVMVQRVVGQGDPIALARLSPGDFVGEMALVDDAPTSAQVVATAETITFEIHKSDFEQLLLADDHIALRVYHGFVKTLTARLRKTTEQVS